MSMLTACQYKLLTLLLVAGTMSACTVPKHMRVDTGLYPQNQDKDVRFRTTYYFRVFDYCADPDKRGIKVPFAIDSLYRFRMTGKAHSLSTQVHFESGTLTAGQIDPFGANVAFDEKNRQFYFKSQQQVQREVARENQFKELQRLLDVYQTLGRELVLKPEERLSEDGRLSEDVRSIIKQQIEGNKGFLEAFRNVIQQQLTEIKGVPSSVSRENQFKELQRLLDAYQKLRLELVPEPGKSLSEEDKRLLEAFRTVIQQQLTEIQGVLSGVPEESVTRLSKPAVDAENYCQNLRRGFQILGPEGWRTFNQDDRLVMAMTSSGKPLISTLNEISGRILDNQPIEAELLLPLIKEDLRITRAERELDKLDEAKPDDIPTILRDAIEQLRRKE